MTNMVKDLKNLGIKKGGYLLVHSSYKSLGSEIKSISQVVESLREALGEEGTLMFPALSYESVGESTPVFDILKTPSCVGAIPEWFRQQKGVLRSMSPTHSVCAIGAHAAEMVCNQEKDDTPVGPNSPFRKLRDVNGQILMLGCGLDPNTSMHGVEELVNPSYLFKEGFIKYKCTDIDGTNKELPVRRHNFSRPGKEVVQRYDRLKYVLPPGVLKVGQVLAALCFLIEAKPMWDIAEIIMKEDQLFFVD